MSDTRGPAPGAATLGPVTLGSVTLRSASLRADVRTTDGAFTALEAAGPWSILTEQDAALGWRMRLPLAHRRDHVLDSRDQEPPRAESGPGVLTLSWPRLRAADGTWLDVSVVVGVRVEGPALVCTMSVDNRSDLVVEDVSFPRLGALRPPPASGSLSSMSWSYDAARVRPLWPRFEDDAGYWGVEVPTAFDEGWGQVGAPVVPFVLAQDGTRGLYLGIAEQTRYVVAWTFELRPGYGESALRSVPQAGAAPAAAPATALPEPAAVRLTAVHLPYVQPGQRRELTPVLLQAYEGDWTAGADVYRDLRGRWGRPVAVPPAWAAEPTSWLQVQVNSPEDELRLPFDRLPQLAAECAEHGIGVIQLVGWDEGGQDGELPLHRADDRLGGEQALRAAVAACQAIGVRVVLFTKFTWADRSTAWYRESLHRSAVRDPFGDPYEFEGHAYSSPAQLFGIRRRQLVPMCFGHEAYVDVVLEQARAVLALGADGMLYDESLHHGRALYCFDESHGHGPVWQVHQADNDLVARMRGLPGQERGFLYAGESPYDAQLEQYDAGYLRSQDPAHVPLQRYLRPEAVLLTALVGFEDRAMVNQCLRYRYSISYEPYHFKGRPGDQARTIAYGEQMNRLRLDLREWCWDGEFGHTRGAVVRDGAGPHEGYSTFRSRADGSVAVVVVNDDPGRAVELEVDTGTGEDPLRWRTVDDEAWRPLPVALAPLSAAVVLPASRVPHRG